MAVRNSDITVDAALGVYFERIDRGEQVDVGALIRQFPACASELESFFAGERRLNARLEKISVRSLAAPSQETRKSANCLTIRCPNCHAPTQVAADSEFTDLTCPSCGSQFGLVDQGQSTTAAPPLMTMGRFELIERLGMGAFGSVWKARDNELDRTVAVKIPRRAEMSAEEQEKFLREARAAAQLSHPNIVRVYEVGRDGESVYIVSDFVRGLTLADWLTGQQPSSREAADLCAKIADALEHAHEKGVVHRDLKPANIMLDTDLAPHIMDFGLARRDVGEITMTMDGHVLGTPAYMSPEQAEGKAHAADRRSDVYSLGVILFQLLTGELPFRGNARMLMHQVIHDEPPSPRKLNANLPRDLETITLKCLEKDPGKRYQRSQEFAYELRRYLTGEPIHARPISQVERAWRWAKRRPAIAGLSVAVGTLLLRSIAVLAAANATIQKESRERELALEEKGSALEKAKESETAATKSAAVATQNEQLAKKNEESARRRYYAAQMNLASGAWRAGNLPRTVAILESMRPAEGEADIRGFEWQHLYHLSHANVVRKWHLPADYSRSLIWPRQANWFASSGLDGVYIWNGENGDLETHLPINRSTWIWNLSATADGQLLAAALNTGEVMVWDVPQRRQLTCWMAHPENVEGARCVAISPDKTRIVTANRNTGGFSIWDINGKRISKHDDSQWCGLIEFSPDGKMLITASCAWEQEEHRATKFWSMEDEPTTFRMVPGWGAFRVALTPDQKTLWSVDFYGSYAIDIESATVSRPFGSTSGPMMGLALLPDQECFITGAADRALRLYDRAKGTSSTIGAEIDRISSLAVSGSGRRVASSDSRGWITLRDLERPNGVVEQPANKSNGDRNDIWHLAYSADGKYLYVGGPTLIEVNNETGKTKDFHRQNILGFSHDGALAASHRWEVGQLDIVDLRTNKVTATLNVEPDVTNVEISADHRFAAVWKYFLDSLDVWDLRANKHLPLAPRKKATCAAFSPTGPFLAFGTATETLAIWNASTQEFSAEMSLPGVGTAPSVQSFSNDGRILAMGFESGTIILWDIDLAGKAKVRCELPGHTDNLVALRFSPDDKQLLSSSYIDDAVRIWDVATGQENITLEESAKVFAFSPLGDQLAIATPDERVRILKTSQLESASARKTTARYEVKQNQASAFSVNSSNPHKAIELLTKSVEQGSASYQVWRMRAQAYLNLGQHANAVADFKRAYDMNQVDLNLLNNFAWVLATSPDDKVRNGKRAVELATKAAEMSQFDAPHILSTLAAAHAELDNFDEAIKWSRRAIELQQQAVDGTQENGLRNIAQSSLFDLQKELDNYERSQPTRKIEYAEDGSAAGWLPNLKITVPGGFKTAAQVRDDVVRELDGGNLNRALKAAAAGNDSTMQIVLDASYDAKRLANFEQFRAEAHNLTCVGDIRLAIGDARGAETVLKVPAPNGEAYPYWYYLSLGQSLAFQGKVEDAKAAFERCLQPLRRTDNSFDLEKADNDQQTAALFLGRLSEDEFLSQLSGSVVSSCHAWYHIGLRRELEGKQDDALHAYQQCIGLYPAKPTASQGFARLRLMKLRRNEGKFDRKVRP